MDKPILPRQRKLPRRLDDGAAPTVHATVEKQYRVIYFEAVDLITSCVSDHFDQPGYKTYAKVQNLLLKAAICNHTKRKQGSLSHSMAPISTPSCSLHI